MYALATLATFRQTLGVNPTDTSEDARLLHALQTATAVMERAVGRKFAPYFATLMHTINPTMPTELVLYEDLLELTSLTNGDGTSIPTNAVQLVHNHLVLLNGWLFTDSTTLLKTVAVNGVWGWHDAWEQAWDATNDSVQNAPLSTSATNITVIDADGIDNRGITPRFSAGQLLKIESEYVIVTAVNTLTNVLTVIRAANGTTASTHAQNTPITTFQPALDVRQVCLQIATDVYQYPDLADGKRAVTVPPALMSLLRIVV